MKNSKRKSVSKKLRFEIFKRDGFTCVYCSSSPPSAVLVIDHIVPVAKGGGNDEDNLCTACVPCNQGKSDRDLNVTPQTLSEKAKLVTEIEEQLLGYQAVMQARRDRIENEAWRVASRLEGQDRIEKYPRKNFESIQMFIRRLGFDEVYDSAERAVVGPAPHYRKFRYFCKVCWNKISGQVA